jgi:hypothetical protein
VRPRLDSLTHEANAGSGGAFLGSHLAQKLPGKWGTTPLLGAFLPHLGRHQVGGLLISGVVADPGDPCGESTGTLATAHRLGTAISFFAGCLNSFAAISIASRSSTASISPTHSRFAASL